MYVHFEKYIHTCLKQWEKVKLREKVRVFKVKPSLNGVFSLLFFVYYPLWCVLIRDAGTDVVETQDVCLHWRQASQGS